MKDDYQYVSKVYNLLSSIYSIGAVNRCRNNVLAEITKGTKVCFVGVGQGNEAVKAVQLGAEVTVVDISISMLERFKRQLSKRGLAIGKVRIENQDVRDFAQSNEGEFDVVVSHFFLNVFSPQQMPEILETLMSLVTTTTNSENDGKLVIGDFYYDKSAPRWVQWIQQANWNLALLIFRRFVRNAKHHIYIYDELLDQLGLNISQDRLFKVIGISLYSSVIVSFKDK